MQASQNTRYCQVRSLHTCREENSATCWLLHELQNVPTGAPQSFLFCFSLLITLFPIVNFSLLTQLLSRQLLKVFKRSQGNYLVLCEWIIQKAVFQHNINPLLLFYLELHTVNTEHVSVLVDIDVTQNHSKRVANLTSVRPRGQNVRPGLPNSLSHYLN